MRKFPAQRKQILCLMFDIEIVFECQTFTVWTVLNETLINLLKYFGPPHSSEPPIFNAFWGYVWKFYTKNQIPHLFKFNFGSISYNKSLTWVSVLVSYWRRTVRIPLLTKYQVDWFLFLVEVRKKTRIEKNLMLVTFCYHTDTFFKESIWKKQSKVSL